MKAILFLLLCGMTLYLAPHRQPTLAAAPNQVPRADTVVFDQQILPILKDRCTPCHFPGGKMYEKMPFDQAKTLLEHPEGMQKRIKDGEAGRLLRAFLAQGKLE